MSEDVQPKKYLIMCDELTIAMLGKLIPGLLFLQIEGVAMQDQPDYMLLANPIPKVPTQEPEPQE